MISNNYKCTSLKSGLLARPAYFSPQPGFSAFTGITV
jgi:hypothetical protein